MGIAAFYVVAAVALLAAFGVVFTRNIVHAALFLLASLLGVAGAFVLLYAEFLALVQILIYGGAITIVILFALMLTRSSEYEEDAGSGRSTVVAAVVATGLFALMAAVFVADAERFNSSEREGVAFETLARDLFVEWAVPFEAASLVLLVALVGAVVIGRAGREEDESFPEAEESSSGAPDGRRAGGGRPAPSRADGRGGTRRRS